MSMELNRRKPTRNSRDNFNKVLASWSEAVAIFYSRLTDAEKEKIDPATLKTPFSELLDTAKTVKQKVDSSRYPWTPKLQSAIECINKYAVVGDLIIQHHAEYTSLVWGTVRFLLLFAAEEHRVSETIANGLDTVVQIVFRAEEYAKLFSAPANSTTDRVFWNLQKNLTGLYAEALNFLVRATFFFQKGSLRRFVSAGLASDTKLAAILDALHQQESTVEKDKSLLESESRRKREEYENGLWLQAADFDGDLTLRKQEYQLGTCSWLLNHKKYVRFRSEDTKDDWRFIWLIGKPGCGKSVLATQIIEDLRSAGRALVYVLCKTGQRRKDSLDAVLCNIILQLLQTLSQRSRWHRALLAIRQQKQKEVTECIEPLWQLLERILQDSEPFYLVLDAIDECKEVQSEQYRFLERLATYFEKSPSSRIVSTSRLQWKGPENNGLWTVIPIDPNDTRADIDRIVAERFRSSKILAALPEKARLQKAVVEKSEGMVLWAKLVMQEMETNQWDPDGALIQLPHSLHALYDAILSRVLANEASSSKSTSIKLVLAATQALRMEELALGVAVAQGLKRHEDYNNRGDPINEATRIVRECNPLLTIDPDGCVQVVHATLRQYLLEEDHSLPNFDSPAVHCQMATILMKYQSLDCFTAAGDVTLTPKHYLIEYATRNLLQHCEETTDGDIPRQLADFLTSAPGWKWARRLISTYLVRPEHVILWQHRLGSWSASSATGTATILSNFLLFLVSSQAKSVEHLPSDSLVRASALHDLAFVYRFIGRLQESKSLFEEVLVVRRQTLGKENFSTLETLSNLAYIAQEEGQWRRAIDIYIPLIEAAQRTLGEEDVQIAMDQNQLATVYIAQDRLSEAEALLRKLLVTARHNEDQYHVPLSLLNLAIVLQMQGRREEATKLLDAVLERIKDNQDDDVFTAQITLLRANQLEFEGRYDISEQLHLQRIEAMERLHGFVHPRTIGARVAWMNLLIRQARWEDAEKLLVPMVETCKKMLRAEHPDLLVYEGRVATLYSRTGQYEKAEEALPKLIAASQTEMGAEHIETVLLVREFGNLRAAQGRYSEAETMQSDARSILERIRDENHPATLETMHMLALTWYALGKQTQAIEMMETVSEKRGSLLGPKHPDTISAQDQVAEWKDTATLSKA